MIYLHFEFINFQLRPLDEIHSLNENDWNFIIQMQTIIIKVTIIIAKFIMLN